MSGFSDARRVEKRISPVAIAAIEKALNMKMVEVNGWKFQNEGKDCVGVNPATGCVLTCENKCREKDWTGDDVLMEDWSNFPQKRGWAFTSTADLLATYWEDTKRLLILDWGIVKPWYADNFKNFILNRQTKYRQPNDTRFRCPKIFNLPLNCVVFDSRK